LSNINIVDIKATLYISVIDKKCNTFDTN